LSVDATSTSDATRRTDGGNAHPAVTGDGHTITRIPAAIAAQRASISRTTLVKIEKGDPGVAVGIYAMVLFVLGMADRLGDLAAPKNDPVGLQLEEENLPQRIRVARRPKRTKDE